MGLKAVLVIVYMTKFLLFAFLQKYFVLSIHYYPMNPVLIVCILIYGCQQWLIVCQK